MTVSEQRRKHNETKKRLCNIDYVQRIFQDLLLHDSKKKCNNKLAAFYCEHHQHIEVKSTDTDFQYLARPI